MVLRVQKFNPIPNKRFSLLHLPKRDCENIMLAVLGYVGFYIFMKLVRMDFISIPRRLHYVTGCYYINHSITQTNT